MVLAVESAIPTREGIDRLRFYGRLRRGRRTPWTGLQLVFLEGPVSWVGLVFRVTGIGLEILEMLVNVRMLHHKGEHMGPKKAPNGGPRPGRE